ncbi:MAG: Mrp/NBP35 family ATP-binding protein [Alphaproteobacteria bacterium]
MLDKVSLPPQVLDALSLIEDPVRLVPLKESGRQIEGHTHENTFHLFMEITLEEQKAFEEIKEIVETTLSKALLGQRVQVAWTAKRTAPETKKATAPALFPLPHMKLIIGVTSAKGGVGKSTLSLNLAVALRMLGIKVGLLDADLYGPSLPTLLGTKGPASTTASGKIDPLWVGGMPTMSMGFLIPEGQPVLWRGPMVQTALKQLLLDVAWPALEVLLIDLPPGTGDLHMTLTQRVPLAGVVVVSTPQEVALQDVRRGLDLFERMSVPFVGLVENMASFVCAHCHKETPIFGEKGGRRLAEEKKIPFLGHLPLDPGIARACDKGVPAFIQEDLLPATKHAYQSVAAAVAMWVRKRLVPQDNT